MSQVPPSLGVSGLLLPALIGAAYFNRCLGQAVFFDQRQTVRALGGLTLALSFYAGMLQLLLYANWVRLPVLLSLFVASLLASHLLARRRVVAPNAIGSDRYFLLSAAPLFALAATALGVATLAAYWLPVWAWDSHPAQARQSRT